jgi:hypothetical protein
VGRVKGSGSFYQALGLGNIYFTAHLESVVTCQAQYGAILVQNDAQICVKFGAILGFKVRSKNAFPFDSKSNQNRSLRMSRRVYYGIG